MSVTSAGAEFYNNSDGIQLPSLFHFFHVFCKISNFHMWTVKHLAQASCTELTLIPEKLKNSTKRMVLLHLIFVIFLLLRSEFCQCSRWYRNSDQNFGIPLTEAPVSLVGKLRSEFLEKLVLAWWFKGYYVSLKKIEVCKFIHRNNYSTNLWQHCTLIHGYIKTPNMNFVILLQSMPYDVKIGPH